MTLSAVPLADHGFVPIGERNPVRWYVVDEDRPGWMVGPFGSMLEADDAAAIWAAGGRTAGPAFEDLG